ncbi:MAG: glycosyltransferase family 2 protein [Solirubrobacterales bacterium]
MTLVVRNEVDIIEDNLRYHRAQGVDFFIALDNGSTDGTVEILERYKQAGILTLLHRPGNMLTIQRKGTTEIARLAHEMGADWVFHNDADEFWWPFADGNLKEAFERIPEHQGVVLIPRTEFIPRPDRPGSFAEQLTIRESRFRRPPKTAHRTHPSIKLWTAHPIDLWVKREAPPRSGLVGKPSLRIEAAHKEDQELDLVLAPEFPIGALHFPLRSFEQYRKKIAIADHNKMWERNEETRALHDAYRSGRLEEVFANLLLDDEIVATGLREGWLVEDTALRDYLRACPGGLEEGEAPPGASAWPAERREAALAELREDGMYVISRYMQTVASKKRTRHLQARKLKKLRARVKESRQELWAMERRSRRLERRSRRLEKVEKSRWWRMRPRLPARRRPGH